LGYEFLWTPARCAQKTPVSTSTVASVLSAKCAMCNTIVIGGATRFHDALDMLQHAEQAPMKPSTRWRASPDVGFVTAPCGATWTW
jgi:hypothetical protein